MFEVPERDALEAVTALESLRVKLAHVFRDAIGRDRGGLHVFRLGKRGGLAVGRRGGGEDDALDFIVAAARRTFKVPSTLIAVGFERILDRARKQKCGRPGGSQIRLGSMAFWTVSKSVMEPFMKVILLGGYRRDFPP